MHPHEAHAEGGESRRECPGCEFRPFSEAYDRDPHPTHAHLREQHRVYFWQELDAWVLSRHEDVDWLLKRAPVGTSDVHWEHAEAPRDAAAASPWDRLRRQTITFQEGAAHARMRSSVSRTFTPAAAARLGPAIAGAVDQALLRIGTGAGRFDLVEEMTSRVPIQVLGRLLGVPAGMEAEFCRHAARLQNVINPLGDAAARTDANASATAVRSMIEELIRRARRRPRDADLLSALLHLDPGEGLEREELVGLLTSILMAGAETTGGMVNHAIAALLAHPEELARLRAEPARLGAAVDELARFEFPTKFVTRYPLEPIEVAGVRIGRGELVFGVLGAANRDPRVFRDPDRLDFSRSPGPVLSFGAGSHFCLGAALARAEAREMIGRLVARFPGLAVAEAPHFSPHFNIRRMASFRLERGAETRP
jgi:cytochrome P450